MKKRFTLMMMVLCILMSIPLKMMADDVVTVKSDYNGGKWTDAFNSNFTFITIDGIIYTCTLNNVSSGNPIYFRIIKGGKQYGPNPNDDDLLLTSSYQTIYENYNKALKINPTPGKTSYTITYDSENNQIKYDAPESGGTTGGGPEGGSGTTENWDTETVNRLKGRVYSQGFYLAGNFFSFQPKENVDHGDLITYDDAVFKFQQQKNDATIETGKDYEVYKVEIPASLTAHAQVMYVDEFGNTKNIFGPGSAYGVSYTNPKTDESIGWYDAKVNGCVPITQENTNYWLFASRNVSSTEYSDGMYNLYIAVDAKTHTVKKWKIEHDSDRRVAYFISDAPNATAMPVYDAFDTSHGSNKFSNKFYASVNFSAERNYYVISNYLKSQQYVSWTEQDYETKTNIKDYVSTTNKLFLLGNGGSAYYPSSNTHLFSPNEKPMPGGDLGNVVVEYNPSNGYDNLANNEKHLGFSGQVLLVNGTVKIKSVSMVGDAIPGTLKEGGSWDFTSKAADMIYDDVEQCYTTTIVTTVDDGKKHFRFVGNHDSKINWFEDTDGTAPEKMAKTPYTDSKKNGHSADASDPNKVNYTNEGKFSEDKYHILWNRDAGRWTVRLYFYTRNVDGGNPKTDYYYTITESRDMELHDVEDLVYGTSDNKQNITNLGGYKFMRTWSAKKAWKISDKVDIFVVSGFTDVESGVTMILTKINGDKTGADNVIPANTGVILATKSDASEIPGAQFKSRQNFTSYNNLVIPMEQYGTDVTYDGTNFLEKILDSRVIPSSDENNYNYLFGYYNTQIAKGNKTDYKDDEYLLGFWISKGSKPYSSNSSYLPIPKKTAAKMNYLGTSYNDFLPGATGGSAKKIPALLFDFANVGGTTGINEVVNQSTKLNDGKYYTLSGQQVEKPTAGGIYIHNGRKFVVK